MAELDDVAGLFLPPPAAPSQPVAYRQGVITSFDPATLSNAVDVGGTILTDLPLLGVGEATLLTVGSVVGLVVISSGGASQMAILGRLVLPNTPAATESIGLLNSLVFARTVPTLESRSADTYGDLTTPGPEVTVTVRPSGRLLVLITSQVQFVETAAVAQRGGEVTVELSGANTVTPTAANDVLQIAMNLGIGVVAPGASIGFQGSYTGSGVFEGLNPGVTTVTMKYRSQYAGEQVDFLRRNLIAITL